MYFFESAAFWSRNDQARKMRDDWYGKLISYYTHLIRRIHPKWSVSNCEDTAFQVLTLILGGWITMGSSRPVEEGRRGRPRKRALLDGIHRLVGEE